MLRVVRRLDRELVARLKNSKSLQDSSVKDFTTDQCSHGSRITGELTKAFLFLMPSVCIQFCTGPAWRLEPTFTTEVQFMIESYHINHHL